MADDHVYDLFFWTSIARPFQEFSELGLEIWHLGFCMSHISFNLEKTH